MDLLAFAVTVSVQVHVDLQYLDAAARRLLVAKPEAIGQNITAVGTEFCTQMYRCASS